MFSSMMEQSEYGARSTGFQHPLKNAGTIAENASRTLLRGQSQPGKVDRKITQFRRSSGHNQRYFPTIVACLLICMGQSEAKKISSKDVQTHMEKLTDTVNGLLAKAGEGGISAKKLNQCIQELSLWVTTCPGIEKPVATEITAGCMDKKKRLRKQKQYGKPLMILKLKHCKAIKVSVNPNYNAFTLNGRDICVILHNGSQWTLFNRTQGEKCCTMETFQQISSVVRHIRGGADGPLKDVMTVYFKFKSKISQNIIIGEKSTYQLESGTVYQCDLDMRSSKCFENPSFFFSKKGGDGKMVRITSDQVTTRRSKSQPKPPRTGARNRKAPRRRSQSLATLQRTRSKAKKPPTSKPKEIVIGLKILNGIVRKKITVVYPAEKQT